MKGYIMPTFIDSTTPSVPTFDSLLAKMLPHFRYYARRYSRCKRTDRDDVMQDLIGLALEMYTSQIRRGKQVFYTPLMKFAIKKYRSGRRFTGSNTTDILSEQTQMLGRCEACQFSELNSEPGQWSFEHYNRQPNVVDAVQMSVDYDTWIERQTERDRAIMHDLAMGETTGEVAKKYGVSAGLISQYRRRYDNSWHAYIADKREMA
jgi:hypothetical protein